MPALPDGVGHSTEVRGAGGLYTQPHWDADMPWVAQGITARGGNMSLFTDTPVGDVLARWHALRDALHCRIIVHSRQVHEAAVHVHRALPEGLLLAADADGHATRDVGVLLAVSVADCVPINVVAPQARALALLHGGWRGIAAGILERGIARLTEELGARTAELRVHLGPAICGECYEVGGAVVSGLGLPAVGPGTAHVDIRAVLARRARALGVPAAHISVSTHCTRHGDSPFYSHRGGCRERQISVLALRA
ncbi:MAG TPA: laccase domain-containing protein [Longimicrobiales bacterium]|nr:laccase domain-containing protein [Longimicrobiales bacterium]